MYYHLQWDVIFIKYHPQWDVIFIYYHPQWDVIFMYYHPRWDVCNVAGVCWMRALVHWRPTFCTTLSTARNCSHKHPGNSRYCDAADILVMMMIIMMMMMIFCHLTWKKLQWNLYSVLEEKGLLLRKYRSHLYVPWIIVLKVDEQHSGGRVRGVLVSSHHP